MISIDDWTVDLDTFLSFRHALEDDTSTLQQR